MTARTDLASFVPRLTLEWLRTDPERLWLEVDGTLVFFDISGFTAMSEQLSVLGKAGAEEVTDVMNATFAALLQVAYAEGGGLLKFGGDALLLLFDGEEHARRAARAAFGMRRVLRAIAKPRTSAGGVQLRMHAGIHSSTFHFFLVGGSHRELLVTGPGVTRTVELEEASVAGEILVSPETAALLDPGVVGRPKGSGLLLQAEPRAGRDTAPLPDATGLALEIAVPAPLRAQLLEVGPLEGEHRNGAVAFVRYAGVDDVIERDGPEAAAGALDALVRAIQASADEHKVTFLESDVDRDGGRIVLVAGAPQTFGNDEERMLRTLRSVVDNGVPFPVHVGASRGRVFTGQVGAPFRRTYTLLGDTAALAARLMARADEHEIYVAADAFARSGGAFEATELEPFRVKGKGDAVHAVRLGKLAAATQAKDDTGNRPEPPFVDRERERAVLGAAVAPVRMGFGTLVELIGEPGIGKSRLAKELEENSTGMLKVGARCEQYESTTPYHPFRPMLRSLLDVALNGDREHNRQVLAMRLAELDDELVAWAPLLAAPLDVEVASTPEVDDLDPAFWRARLHGVMAKLLGSLLGSPTMLLFEDVHWMDDASSDLLRFLASQLSTRPWLVCTTRRAGDGGFAAAASVPPLPALTLRLEPLPDDDARALVRAAAGDRDLGEEELSALMGRGAGNPLFLQELAASEETAEEERELPETVQALVATRIDRLSPGDRALLRWASVLGESFSGSLIVHVLDGDERVAAASEAWDRLGEFVEMDPDVPGAFRFRHALIRDAAYEGLSYKRRRDLHERVAEVIERQEGADAAELLSLHFHRAERWQETWRYSVEAGTRAWGKHANVEAAQFFQCALEIVDRVPEVPREEVARVWEALGDAEMRTARYERAGEAFRAARESFPGDPVEQARLMQKEAVAPLRLGQYADALSLLTAALRTIEHEAGAAATAQRARLCSWYGRVLQYQRRPDDAVPWCKRAISEAEASGAEDALAHAYYILDWAYVALGRRDEAVYSEWAIEIYERLGDLDRLAWVLNNLGGITYLAGRWDEAVELAERARETFEKIGDETSATTAAKNVAEVRLDQGRIDEAGPVLRAALPVRRAAANPVKIAEVASLLGRYAARVGDFEEARALLEEARDLYASAGDETELLTTEARLVELLVLEGAGAAALPVVKEALRRADSLTGVSVARASLHRLLGWAHMQTHELEAASGALQESLRCGRTANENFGIRSEDYEVALTIDALARLAELSGEPAEELERERDEILDRLGVVVVPNYPVVTPSPSRTETERL